MIGSKSQELQPKVLNSPDIGEFVEKDSDAMVVANQLASHRELRHSKEELLAELNDQIPEIIQSKCCL